jgi:hypothetical protein
VGGPGFGLTLQPPQAQAELQTRFVPRLVKDMRALLATRRPDTRESAQTAVKELRDLVLRLPSMSRVVDDQHQKAADLLTFLSFTNNFFVMSEPEMPKSQASAAAAAAAALDAADKAVITRRGTFKLASMLEKSQCLSTTPLDHCRSRVRAAAAVPAGEHVDPDDPGKHHVITALTSWLGQGTAKCPDVTTLLGTAILPPIESAYDASCEPGYLSFVRGNLVKVRWPGRARAC